MIDSFLQINLTTRCNSKCSWCPISSTRTERDPEWGLTNEELIPFLRRLVDNNKWLIELTGGEPTLYRGYTELLDWLDKNNYIVHIRTNGKIVTPYHKNATRIVAFHDFDMKPLNYDLVLIIDGIDSERKIKWCRDNGVRYFVIGKDKHLINSLRCKFRQIASIDPFGHLVKCGTMHARVDIQEIDGKFVDVNRLPYIKNMIVGVPCDKCKAAIDAYDILNGINVDGRLVTSAEIHTNYSDVSCCNVVGDK